MYIFSQTLNWIFYKTLFADDWENSIDGIIRKPQEVVRALMEYKYDASVINSAISYGTNSEKTQSQIKAIESNNLLWTILKNVNLLKRRI